MNSGLESTRARGRERGRRALWSPGGARHPGPCASPPAAWGGQGSTAALARRLYSPTLSRALAPRGSQEEPRSPVSTGTRQYPPAPRCFNPVVASLRPQLSPAPGYSPPAARGTPISLGSGSRPVNLQIHSENPGPLVVGISSNVAQHPADAAPGTRHFAWLSALGARLPSLSGQVNLLEPEARCFRPGAFKKGAFGKIRAYAELSSNPCNFRSPRWFIPIPANSGLAGRKKKFLRPPHRHTLVAG